MQTDTPYQNRFNSFPASGFVFMFIFFKLPVSANIFDHLNKTFVTPRIFRKSEDLENSALYHIKVKTRICGKFRQQQGTS